MLVLSRHVGEEVLIGDDIVLKVVKIKGDNVWLAFEAPKSVRIDRREVREKIKAEQAGDEDFAAGIPQ